MHDTLHSMREAGEDYQNPVYAVFRKENFFYRSTTCGFMATTDHQRLLVAPFQLIGIPQEGITYLLQSLQSVKISKVPLTQIYSIKLCFNCGGKKQKLCCVINRKVYGTDLNAQEQNLENLMAELQKWGN